MKISGGLGIGGGSQQRGSIGGSIGGHDCNFKFAQLELWRITGELVIMILDI